MEIAFYLLCIFLGTILAVSAPLILNARQKSRSLVRRPPRTKHDLPLIGDLRFFSHRWGIFEQSSKNSGTKNFFFHLGRYPVIALRGHAMRRIFFDNKHFDPWEGYGALLNSGPQVDVDLSDKNLAPGFQRWFINRVNATLRRDNLLTYLPLLIKDVRGCYDGLGDGGSMDPFDTIYLLSFQLSMRLFGCSEIANSPSRIEEAVHLFESIERFSNPLSVLFPWFPHPWSMIKSYYNKRLISMMSNCIKKRQSEGRKEMDATQILLDAGDELQNILQFILNSLFASVFDTGVNAASIICYLGASPYWRQRCLQEIRQTARERCPPEFQDSSIQEQLANLPLDAWERGFPICDLCSRDSIRLNLVGSLYRRNMSSEDVILRHQNGVTEAVRPGDFITYNLVDIHYDPEVYADPYVWDPSRYLEDRAEDKKIPLAYVGWGAGRHPCKGTAYVKHALKIIISHFVAEFDWKLIDSKGETIEQVPPIDRDLWGSTKWKNFRVQYQRREN